MQICIDQRNGTGCGLQNRDGAQFCQKCGRPLRYSLQLRDSGDVAGSFRIVRLIGYGGFGAVYEAEDSRQSGNRVALKETFDPDQIQSFQGEFVVLSRMHHPHLPRYYTTFVEGDNGYLAMEFVPGQNLRDVLDRQKGPLSEAQVLGYALQLCDALAYLHSQNPPILHRDIKPENVRLTPEGLIKLVDFGLVKEGTEATRSSRRAVTPAYAPLEQWGKSGQHTDQRSDIYSLGATLYHLLTGQEPPAATDRLAHSPDPLVSPQIINPALSQHVADAILAATAIQMQDRPSTVADLRAALVGRGQSAQAVHPRRQTMANQNNASPVLAPPTPNYFPSRSAPPAQAAPKQARWFAWAGWIVVVLPLLFLISPWGAEWLTAIQAYWGMQTASRSVPPPVALISTETATPTPTVATATPTPTTAPTITPTTTPTTEPVPGAVLRNPVDDALIVYIPSGEYTMGINSEMLDYILSRCPSCNKEPFISAMPQHQVYLDSFWIYQTEVTNGEYARCVSRGVCNPPKQTSSETRPDYYQNPVYAEYPVVYVDWLSAQQYCQWAGGRLPREAEWERAARGNDDRLFPWGDNPPDSHLANVNQAIGDTTAVGSYPAGASPFGVLDMAGNVWEWVYDWHDPDYYQVSAYRNPTGPDRSDLGRRVGRGGSWYWGGIYASSVYHDWWEPEKSDNGVGFRCVIPDH